MPPSRLDNVSRSFCNTADALHEKFLAAMADPACAKCTIAGYGTALLTAWLQTKWSDFAKGLLLASALGTKRKTGPGVRPAPSVKTRSDAEALLKVATTATTKRHGLQQPVWHAPWFVIEVAAVVRLRNLNRLELTLGSTVVPKQITDFRNYLIHPTHQTRVKYEDLQAKFGMLGVEPQHFIQGQRLLGVPVFTSWVRELQRVAHASTR